MNPYTQAIIAQLLGIPQQQQPRDPNNIDQMVVPPYGLPHDKNTFMPDAVQSLRMSPFAWQEKI